MLEPTLYETFCISARMSYAKNYKKLKLHQFQAFPHRMRGELEVLAAHACGMCIPNEKGEYGSTGPILSLEGTSCVCGNAPQYAEFFCDKYKYRRVFCNRCGVDTEWARNDCKEVIRDDKLRHWWASTLADYCKSRIVWTGGEYAYVPLLPKLKFQTMWLGDHLGSMANLWVSVEGNFTLSPLRVSARTEKEFKEKCEEMIALYVASCIILRRPHMLELHTM